MYANPTIRSLAQHLAGLARGRAAAVACKDSAAPREDRLRHSSTRVWLCGLAQFGLAYVLAVFLGAPLAHLLGAGYHPLLALPLAAVLTMPVTLLLPFAAKWLLIGRFRPGRYRLWGWYYCRFWLVRKIMGMSPLGYLAGSPFLALYARLLGARVGKGCHLGSARLQLPDLIEIGAGASVGYGAAVEPYAVKDGWLYLAPVRIGKNAYVGINSVVMLGGQVGDGAMVLEQSLVAQDQVIPDNETWAGSPSRRVADDHVLQKMAARRAPCSSIFCRSSWSARHCSSCGPCPVATWSVSSRPARWRV